MSFLLVTEVPPTPNCNTGRRSKLPAPKPDNGDFSLCNLLFKNIGKDLCKVSMPVTLNEPLSVLQVFIFGLTNLINVFLETCCNYA